MSDKPTKIRDKLLADIQRDWDALNTTIGGFSDAQLTGVFDAQGWSVKDHLIHLAYWERGVLFFLRGKPRHTGMEVDEELYLNGSFDEINAIIQRMHADLLLDEALTLLRDVHREMLEQLQKMSDPDLQKPYRRYLPDEPGVGEGPPAINVVYANTAEHFAEHRVWIKALVSDRM